MSQTHTLTKLGILEQHFLPVFFPQVHLLADGKAQQLDTTIKKQ